MDICALTVVKLNQSIVDYHASVTLKHTHRAHRIVLLGYSIISYILP